MILTLQSRNTLTVPREIRQALALQPGDPLDAQIEQGRLVLTPVSVVPRSIRLSESGEAKERSADADIREGRVSTFASAEELLENLSRNAS
jgi:bifunctional DNA-binding transcriptional regulator/antitoxin component of YhaV-PrlF toxin-antitoxin module